MSTAQPFDVILTGSVPDNPGRKSGSNIDTTKHMPNQDLDSSAGRNNPRKEPGEGLNREQNLQIGESNTGRGQGLERDQDLGRGRGDIGRSSTQRENDPAGDLDDPDLLDDDLEDDVE